MPPCTCRACHTAIYAAIYVDRNHGYGCAAEKRRVLVCVYGPCASCYLEFRTARVYFSTQHCHGCRDVRFNVGSTPAEDDVVSDGQPWVYFDSRPDADGKRLVVGAETPATTFFVWLKPHKCHNSCTESQLAAATSRGTPEECVEVSSSAVNALVCVHTRVLASSHRTCGALTVVLLSFRCAKRTRSTSRRQLSRRSLKFARREWVARCGRVANSRQKGRCH